MHSPAEEEFSQPKHLQERSFFLWESGEVSCVCGGGKPKAGEGDPPKPSSHTTPGTSAVTQHSCQIPLDRHRIATTQVKPGAESSKETGQKLGSMDPNRQRGGENPGLVVCM